MIGAWRNGLGGNYGPPGSGWGAGDGNCSIARVQSRMFRRLSCRIKSQVRRVVLSKALSEWGGSLDHYYSVNEVCIPELDIVPNRGVDEEVL